MPVLRELLAPHRRPLVLAVSAGAVTPLAGIALVAVSTYLISASALRPNLLDLTVAIVGVRALSLLKGVSRYVERLTAHDVALRVVVDLRTALYDRLVPQAPAGLARHRSGDVLARVVGDVERLQLALVRGVVPLLGGGLAAVAVVVIAGVLLPAAAPVVAAGIVVAAIGVPLISWRLARRPQRALADARGRLAAELIELLQAAPELRSLGRLREARDRLAAVDAEVERHDRAAVLRGGGEDAAGQLVLGLTTVGLLLIAVPAVSAGSLDGVLLGALVVLGLAAPEAVGLLPVAARSLTSASAAARRLAEVSAAPVPAPDPAPRAGGGDRAVGRVTPRLAFEGVAASYPGMPTRAVHDVYLEVAPGRRIAVIGRSGAGKSTVGLLSVRFLDPEAGVVRLDAAPMTSLPGDEVRRWVGLAPQQAQLFEGTVASNLRLAAPEADPSDLWHALEAAQLAAWVAELPRGLDTPVGEGGTRLSGGQRHRLALARTLLAGGPLLVLDEPTTDLDPATGRAFLADALGAAGGRGVLVLTHDLRVLPVVDEVVVLEAGRIVARGPHAQLLTRDPSYARRWGLEVGSAV